MIRFLWWFIMIPDTVDWINLDRTVVLCWYPWLSGLSSQADILSLDFKIVKILYRLTRIIAQGNSSTLLVYSVNNLFQLAFLKYSICNVCILKWKDLGSPMFQVLLYLMIMHWMHMWVRIYFTNSIKEEDFQLVTAKGGQIQLSIIGVTMKHRINKFQL